jgi:hypothetical protein
MQLPLHGETGTDCSNGLKTIQHVPVSIEIIDLHYTDEDDLAVFRCNAARIRGINGRLYFSEDHGRLEKPHRLPNSNLFVETSLSANNAVGFVKAAASIFAFGEVWIKHFPQKGALPSD